MFPKKRKPTHPGIILQEEFLKPLNLSPKQCIQKLGSDWTELRLTAFIQGKEGLSDKAAQELAAALGTSAQFWIHLAQTYYQWEERKHHNEKGSLKPWKKAQ